MLLVATFTDIDTDRAARIFAASSEPGSYLTVFFGRLAGEEFICSHSKPSRHYNTENRARRAADGWCMVGR